jgi:hypothetical protein
VKSRFDKENDGKAMLQRQQGKETIPGIVSPIATKLAEQIWVQR